MGQYFRYVNVDKQEVVQQPDGTKLPEVLSSGLSGQVLMYLMFDGPFDGTTSLPGLYAEGDEFAEDLADEFIADERRLEDETDRESVYRDDDGGWDRDRARRVALAGAYTGEHAICGRWAGDDVRIIGDYAEDNYYHAIDGTVVVETGDMEQVEYYGRHPKPVDYDSYEERADPGDIVETYSLDGNGPQEVTFVEHIEDNGWSDITDSVFAEMARYSPDLFGELAEDRDLDPDIVFGSGSNPERGYNDDTIYVVIKDSVRSKQTVVETFEYEHHAERFVDDASESNLLIEQRELRSDYDRQATA